MNVQIILNIVGLSFNIIGASSIWRFGLPPNIDREGRTHLITNQIDIKEKILGKKYIKYSKLGMLLLILGFVCQFLALFF